MREAVQRKMATSSNDTDGVLKTIDIPNNSEKPSGD